MRPTVLFVCSALIVGCAGEEELQFRSTLAADTQGVALSDDGLKSYAAMVGTTCTIDTSWGCPTADADLPTENERVTDHYLGRTLAVSADGVHYMDAGTWDGGTEPLADLRTAKLSDVGTLVVGGTPDSCWYQDAAGEHIAPGAACEPGVSFEVDRRGSLVAATPEGIIALDPAGVRTVHSGADLVAVDAAGGRMYLANRGESTLTAIDDAGTTLWTAEAGGNIADIAVRGDRQDVMVLADVGGGLGQIERFDGADGIRHSSSTVPTTDGELAVSGNGQTLALIRDGEVHHFSILVDGEEQVVRDEVANCPDLPIRQGTGVTAD